jgi:hypothetical protein
MAKLQRLPHRHQRTGDPARNWRRPAAGASAVGALALTLVFPVLGTPILAGLTVLMIWLELRSR